MKKFSMLLEKVGIVQPEQTKFLSKELNNMLIDQIAIEMKGHYAYIAMRAYFKKLGLDGFANYFEKQASEEATHAQKIISFLLDSGSELKLKAVPAPDKADFSEPLEAAKKYLDLEKSVTKNWQDIYKKVQDTENWAAVTLAQNFLDEQIQEEDAAVTFVSKVSLAGDSNLLILDQEFAKRQ